MEEKALMITNALYSDLKLKKLSSQFGTMARRVEEDKVIYADKDGDAMIATFYPLFELEGEEFRPFIDMPQPSNVDEFNALIAALYTNYAYLDCIGVGDPDEKGNYKKQIWIGLKEFKLFE